MYCIGDFENITDFFLERVTTPWESWGFLTEDILGAYISLRESDRTYRFQQIFVLLNIEASDKKIKK